jgi:hypothetical protein
MDVTLALYSEATNLDHTPASLTEARRGFLISSIDSPDWVFSYAGILS